MTYKNTYLSIIYCTIILLLPSHGLQVRDQDTSDNMRFTGFPNSTSANPFYAYSSYDFTGVGWYVQDTRRQFALVSPQHFVCATHFRPSDDGQISFLGSDGNTYTYEILNSEIIQNETGENTDLTLVTLETVVDTRVITPLKYGNFTFNDDEIPYRGTGIIFGQTALTGNTSFDGIMDPEQVPGLSGNFANTQYIRSDFSVENSNEDNNESYVQIGDSGSPLFFIKNGQIALIGTNSLFSNTTRTTITPGTGVRVSSFSSQTSLATFLPNYIHQLNTAMNEEGYHMTAVNPAPTSIDLELTSTSEISLKSTNTPKINLELTNTSEIGLKSTNTPKIDLELTNTSEMGQGLPGSLQFTIFNTGTNTAENISITTISNSAVPDSLVSDYFFPGLTTSNSKEIHSPSLPPETSATIEINWSQLPTTDEFTLEVIYTADGVEHLTKSITLNLFPTYLSFTTNLEDQSLDGDPDGDGISNLFEYALGGNAAETSGRNILPQFNRHTGVFSFLRRTDAKKRGLTYSIQCSHSLGSDEWLFVSQDLVSTSSSDMEGFEIVSVPLPSTPSGSIFYRLLVELDE